MNLEANIKKNKKAILNLWIKKFTETYPEESAQFFRANPGQFNNPVGYSFRINMEKIFDEFFQDCDLEKLRSDVDGITRIRAVHNFTASQAVCFVPMFRESIWEVCGQEISREGLLSEWLEMTQRLDMLMNLAFDTYMACREQLWEHKANFLYSRTHKLLERANVFDKAAE